MSRKCKVAMRRVGARVLSRARAAARHGRAMIARKTWNDRFTEIAAPFVKLSAIPVIISDSGTHAHLHIESRGTSRARFEPPVFNVVYHSCVVSRSLIIFLYDYLNKGDVLRFQHNIFCEFELTDSNSV